MKILFAVLCIFLGSRSTVLASPPVPLPEITSVSQQTLHRIGGFDVQAFITEVTAVYTSCKPIFRSRWFKLKAVPVAGSRSLVDLVVTRNEAFDRDCGDRPVEKREMMIFGSGIPRLSKARVLQNGRPVVLDVRDKDQPPK